MSVFNDLSIKWKLTIPVVMVSFILILLAFSALNKLNNVGSISLQVTKEYLPSINFLLQADRDLYQAMVAERSVIFVDVNNPQFVDLANQHKENIQQAYDRVKKFEDITNSTLAREKLALFFTLYKEWKSSTEEIIIQRRDHGRTGRRVAIDLSFGESAEHFDRMRDIINELSEQTIEAANESAQNMADTIRESHASMLVNVSLGLIFCILIVLFVPRIIIKPLQAILHRVEDIAQGEGDLTLRIEVNAKDEGGKLAAAFNRFVEKLHAIVREIVASSHNLSSSSEHMADIVRESYEAMKGQRMETESVVTAIHEMSATVQEVARNAAHAAQAAQEGDSQAKEGRMVIGDTIAGIHSLATEVENASQVISQLENDTSAIGTVLDVIKGIAEQTNLLALNAAIEAARAGEQGRGFAVVADEVRTLAQRTQQSTQEIEEMIERLQTGVQRAVTVMQEGRNQATESVARAGKAESSLNGITHAIESISDMNAQIASAAEEQTAVAEEINRSMIKVSELTEQTEAGAKETSASVNALIEMAISQERLVSQFKI
ncbi:MAG: methyl-accepting chemotaxis protein [Gammaproteobacteria bacterium]